MYEIKKENYENVIKGRIMIDYVIMELGMDITYVDKINKVSFSFFYFRYQGCHYFLNLWEGPLMRDI